MDDLEEGEIVTNKVKLTGVKRPSKKIKIVARSQPSKVEESTVKWEPKLEAEKTGNIDDKSHSIQTNHSMTSLTGNIMVPNTTNIGHPTIPFDGLSETMIYGNNMLPVSNLTAISSQEKEKKKQKDTTKKATFRVNASGQKYQDSTLEEWPENDFRIFVGNLGNENTDETLTTAFASFPSFYKAKVILDKYTNKVKFGFVSFLEPIEGFKAMKSMNGKFIPLNGGSKPVQLKRVDPKERATNRKGKKMDKRAQLRQELMKYL